MFWQEDTQQEDFIVPDNVVDLSFQIDCRGLLVDHAYPLSSAIQQALPWFGESRKDGLHLIHVAGSGNGWERPSDASALLLPSRRTRLVLRLARDRVENARALSGQMLDIDGHALRVGEAKVLTLSTAATLYARYIAAPADQEEVQFITEMVQQMRTMGLDPKKVMAGKKRYFSTPGGALCVRSLMVADLPPADAIRLQEEGLGTQRTLGCGLFIEHKSINKVEQKQ
ncbi:MAG: type I-MYXAN CRISPR-associated protein Cas6/Cmx6 [Thiohalomonadaceae bacterium]